MIKVTIDVIFSIIAIFTIAISFFNCTGIYSQIFLLPIAYLIFHLSNKFILKNSILLIEIVDFCAFLRYVILPMVYSIEPTFSFSSYSCSSNFIMDDAIYLMFYELIVITLFLLVFKINSKKKLKDNGDIVEFSEKKNKGYKFIKLFIFVTLIMIAINPSVLTQFSFMIIQSNTSVRIGAISSSASSLDMILRQFVLISILFSYVISIIFIRDKYKDKKTYFAIVSSLILSFVCISIIVAEQRSTQIYCAFAAIVLLGRIYKEHRKLIISSLLFSCALIVSLLTIYKTFYVFNSSSYYESIFSSDAQFLKSLSYNLEVYLLGPQTVAAGIEFAEFNEVGIGQFLYDLFRPFIGISFLLKDTGMSLTSEIFNLYVTSGYSSGYLLPLTAHFYAFAGFISSPLLICAVYKCAYELEKTMINSDSEFISFFAAYIYIRFATSMICSNLATIMVSLSSILVSAGVVYCIQWIVGRVRFSK